jgi:hypothetical protein
MLLPLRRANRRVNGISRAHGTNPEPAVSRAGARCPIDRPEIQLGRCCNTDPAKHHPSLSCHREIGQ